MGNCHFAIAEIVHVAPERTFQYNGIGLRALKTRRTVAPIRTAATNNTVGTCKSNNGWTKLVPDGL